MRRLHLDLIAEIFLNPVTGPTVLDEMVALYREEQHEISEAFENIELGVQDLSLYESNRMARFPAPVRPTVEWVCKRNRTVRSWVFPPHLNAEMLHPAGPSLKLADFYAELTLKYMKKAIVGRPADLEFPEFEVLSSVLRHVYLGATVYATCLPVAVDYGFVSVHDLASVSRPWHEAVKILDIESEVAA